ncbi:DsbA family protein [Streptomyces cinnamoneus]|uniref:DsbA family protein n=1 Tax=Streptomyces cinnamoneus TaxID=53446 RepID=UPI003791C4D5
MSQKNSEGKRSARERLHEQRQKEEARAKRKRTLIAAVVVVAVLGVGGGVAALVASTNHAKDNKQHATGPLVAPQGAIGKDNLAVPVGGSGAKATLVVYEDFRCPGCGMFENGYRDTIHDLEDKGQLKAEYHLVTLIDKNLGGSGSVNAANAAACAQDAGKFRAYHDELYKNQPPETDDAFAKKDRLLTLADKVAGLNTASFKKCVEEGTHDSWVHKSQEAFSTSGYRATPTVLLGGKSIYGDPANPLTPEKFRKMVADAQKGGGAGKGSGAPGETGAGKGAASPSGAVPSGLVPSAPEKGAAEKGAAASSAPAMGGARERG